MIRRITLAELGRHRYIYALVDPADDVVRYVGQTACPEMRLRNHCGRGSANSARFNDWLEDLRRSGRTADMLVLERVPTELANERELYWIMQYRDTVLNVSNPVIGADQQIRTRHRSGQGRRRRMNGDEFAAFLRGYYGP